jgi:23S rRNA (adenine-N6)-dimethyltransferase
VAARDARAGSGRRSRAGQHFLRSRRLVAALVDAAAVSPGELILDLGAGRGIITAELATRRASVVAVEYDPALAADLRARFAGAPGVTVVEADARRLRPPDEPFRVVANLPFDGGTAILRRLLDDPRVPLVGADVVLEWSAAAKRAAVWPSTALGAYWSAWHELSLVRRLPRSVFAPPPAVDAGVLRVRRLESPLVDVREARAYCGFLDRCFAGRPRDVVPRRTLKRLAVELGFDRDAAARDLDARQLAGLFRTVRRTGRTTG